MEEFLENLTPLLLVAGLLIVGCVISSKVSARFSMPGLLVFLLIGMGLHLLFSGGTYVTNILPWRHANAIGTVALAFILFSGGFDSSLGDIRKVFRTGTILSTAGVLLTTLLLGSVAYLFAICSGHPEFWPQSYLFGAIISSTDASAVFSILRSKRISLQGDLKPLLEYESGSNDPMATFLTMFFLGLCQNNSSVSEGLLCFLPKFFYQMGAGVGIGIAIAAGAVWLFNHLDLDYDGLYHVLAVAVVLLIYSVTDICCANGYMATYAGGVFMGSRHFVFRNRISRFSDAIGWLMQVILFTILGFMANPQVILKHWGLGILMGLALMFFARPVATFVCMIKSGFSLKAKTLVSWVGLRGGAPIMLATFPMLLVATDYEAAETTAIGSTNFYEIMFNMVFCMVLLSVVVQSFTIMPLARALGLDSPLQVTPTAPISFDQVVYHDDRKAEKGEEHTDDLSYNEPASFVIPSCSDLDGRAIKDLRLPAGVFIVMISRGGKWLVPRGNTVLSRGDSLTVLATPANLKNAEKYFTQEKHDVQKA
ncbi:MAG: potassium/proton antiporter [Lentisphaeria bacterium]|nr:potassium/proton antiporter [Lentisphaeria bacterium]